MSTGMTVAIVGGGSLIIVIIGVLFLIAKFYRKVDQGRALIVNKMKAEPEVTFTGGVVVPIIHRAEVMDISVKTIELERSGHEGLICKDNIRADIKVTFFVRVNKTKEDVLKVAQAIGCARASDQSTLEELFLAKFSEALKTVGKRLEFEQLYTQRDDFKDQIIEVIGQDLNGYGLEDAAIDYLEQTPLAKLDAGNILDAQGIRKITELTTGQNVQTNELKQKERMEIGRQDLAANEAIFRFEQQEAEALAKKEKEINVAQQREQNEALRVKHEEEKRTALALQKAQEEVQIGEQNKQRAVEVAEKAREREVQVEAVRVKKAADVEEISRERDVELRRIEKEKALEVERKEIADVVRARVAVDKTVAEEEERIKDLRAHAGAEREKKVRVVSAEAAAEEHLVKNIKAAEAAEEVAKFEARKLLTIAEADLEASDKKARAKIRLALAKAAGEEEKGMALARVQEAEAAAIAKRGEAEALAIEKKLAAEASGLAEKANAMKALDGVGREHEEFRIRLEKDKEVALASLEAKVRMTEAQAKAMGAAFETAKINIVGGDGQFFDRFVKAVGAGQAIDGFMDNSEVAQAALGAYASGERNLVDDLGGIVGGLNASSLKDLSIAAVFGQLATKTSGAEKEKLLALAAEAKKLGLDVTKVK